MWPPGCNGAESRVSARRLAWSYSLSRSAIQSSSCDSIALTLAPRWAASARAFRSRDFSTDIVMFCFTMLRYQFTRKIRERDFPFGLAKGEISAVGRYVRQQAEFGSLLTATLEYRSKWRQTSYGDKPPCASSLRVVIDT